MDIEHISISRESLWLQCKYKYRYKYHLKTPSPIPEQEYFTYGKIVHKIIEFYTKNKGMIHISDIMKTVIKESTTLSYYYKQQLNEDISQFMLLTKRIGTGGEVEFSFKKDLEHPNQKFVTGVIDRIIENNGSYHILDFKTTKRGQYQKNALNILEDLQLQCYAWVIYDQFKVDASKIKTALYYLNGGNLVPAVFSQKTLENTPKRLLKIYNEIKSTDPDTVVGTVGEHCVRCEYSVLCPWFKHLKV